jgi:hypothetical protein
MELAQELMGLRGPRVLDFADLHQALSINIQKFPPINTENFPG